MSSSLLDEPGIAAELGKSIATGGSDKLGNLAQTAPANYAANRHAADDCLLQEILLAS
jgi:hypothetical protein